MSVSVRYWCRKLSALNLLSIANLNVISGTNVSDVRTISWPDLSTPLLQQELSLFINVSQSNSGHSISLAFRRIFRCTALSELNTDVISDILEFSVSTAGKKQYCNKRYFRAKQSSYACHTVLAHSEFGSFRCIRLRKHSCFFTKSRIRMLPRRWTCWRAVSVFWIPLWAHRPPSLPFLVLYIYHVSFDATQRL